MENCDVLGLENQMALVGKDLRICQLFDRANLCLKILSNDIDATLEALAYSSSFTLYRYLDKGIEKVVVAYADNLREVCPKMRDFVIAMKKKATTYQFLPAHLKKTTKYLLHNAIEARNVDQLRAAISLATNIAPVTELDRAKGVVYDLLLDPQGVLVKPETVWQYSGKRHGWQDYGISANAEIAQAVSAKERRVKIEGGRYEVDLKSLEQKNLKTGCVRNMQCIMTPPSLPPHWSDFGPANVTTEKRDEIQRLIDQTMHSMEERANFEVIACPTKITVFEVTHVRSVELWARYNDEKADMGSRHAEQEVIVSPLSQPPPRCLLVHNCDETINELYAFHGTRPEVANTITKMGFDDRVSKGIYGDGIYFTPSPCKALQYSGYPDQDGLHTLLISRVCLGDAHETKSMLDPGTRRPPSRGVEKLVPHDSVVANVGPMPGRGEYEYQYHQEYVVFEKRQCYPEFVVRVKIG
eukprot:GEMP01003712.1.p1 GENE.GEMP01003712.1~~GEMP01003712.1.p1  ORF type:complete len:469 (+),score=97.28 GEMP01003712.1:757-2163(+)